METNEPRGGLSRRRAIQVGGGTVLGATAAGAFDAVSGSASPATAALATETQYPPNLDALRREIFDQFQEEDFHVHLRRINADKNARLTQTSRPKVVVSNVRDDGSGEHYSLRPVKGSVMIVFAKRGHDLLGALERAYVEGDRAALESLSRVVDEEANRRDVVTISSVVDLLTQAPAYFDLLYDTKLLATNVGLVNGLEYGTMLFPWNGGRLSSDDFTVVEYAKPDADSDFEILLVLTEPDLTQLEREAVDAVPEDMLNINVGTTAASPAACLVVVLIIVVATNLANCGAFHDRLAEVTLPGDVIERLGKVNSALELLRRRRQLFESYGM